MLLALMHCAGTCVLLLDSFIRRSCCEFPGTCTLTCSCCHCVAMCKCWPLVLCSQLRRHCMDLTVMSFPVIDRQSDLNDVTWMLMLLPSHTCDNACVCPCACVRRLWCACLVCVCMSASASWRDDHDTMNLGVRSTRTVQARRNFPARRRNATKRRVRAQASVPMSAWLFHCSCDTVLLL
jgi:hypothetical protein